MTVKGIPAAIEVAALTAVAVTTILNSEVWSMGYGRLFTRVGLLLAVLLPILTMLAVSNTSTVTAQTRSTEVGGIISSDTTWTKADSTYVITSTVQIPSRVTLTIEPGVTVSKPTSGDMFLLMGTIRAHGTAQEPIVFDGGGNSTIVGTWPGYGYGDFEYCIFRG